MADEVLTARFVLAGEAERAATQLRAAGVPDGDVAIRSERPGGLPRDAEVGVPDEGASLQGLDGNAEPPVAAVMTVGLAEARIDRDAVVAILSAAGGRID